MAGSSRGARAIGSERWRHSHGCRGAGGRWSLPRAGTDRAGGVLLPSLFIYLLIAGGFPYTVLMLGVVTAWLALRCVVSARDWFAPFRLAIGWVLGIGLSAPAWLSLIEMSRGSRRATEIFPTRQWMVPFDGLPGFLLPAWSVDWVQFEAQVAPHAALELACGFAPAVVLIVAALTMRGTFLRAHGWLLGLLAFTFLVCMLPGGGMFRFSFRWLPLVHLALALTAGCALEQWLASGRRTRVWGLHNLGWWALLIIVALILAMLVSGQSTSVDTTALPLLFLAIAGIWWAFDGALSKHSLGRQWTAAGVTFVALLMTYRDMATSGPVARYPFQPTLNQPAPLATDRLYLSLYRSPQANYRADQHEWSFGETVRPGSTSMFAGVHLVNGYSPIAPAGVGRLLDFGTHGQINPAKVEEIVIPESGRDRLLADLGIDGIIVAWDFDLPAQLPADWQIAERWSDGYVYHRRERLPHVRAHAGEQISAADVRVVQNTRHRVIAEVTASDASRPVLLLFSRPFFRGYEARIDGEAVPVSAYRGLIPQVEIPAGRSGRIELVYRPMPLIVGGGVTVSSLLALLIAAVVFSRRAGAADEPNSAAR